ncbi:MAG TPA: response regulator [Blastocatellia bacterium]|nr:response regulator [Blastocatellia bacterium]
MQHSSVVLIVEDNPQVSQVVVLLLGLEGVKVITAANGLDGLKQCRTHKPDLIITDLKLPGMDGLEMIQTLRADSECGQVPIIAFTAYAQELTAEAIKAGANGVLSKTGSYDLLLALVKGFTYRPQRARGSGF